MTNTYAPCGHNGCDVRIGLGLTPFCQIPATPKVVADNVFSSYAQATEYTRAKGGRIVCATRSGGPRTFVVTA
jgi:hypothetical protein